jgi:hypothetical protein
LLNIFVESYIDEQIVTNILISAKVPVEIVKVTPTDGKKNMKHYALAEKLSDSNYIFLIDADKLFIHDSKKEAQKQLKTTGNSAFCAVPEIESWVFADDDLLRKEVEKRRDKNIEEAMAIIDRIVITDEIIFPKKVLYKLFSLRKGEIPDYSFLRNMNIEKACLRSTSLRVFITGVFHALGIEDNFTTTLLSRNINRDIFSSLLKEILPSDEVIFRGLNGVKFTAQQMIKEIEAGSQIGKDYCSDIMRISRDNLCSFL